MEGYVKKCLCWPRDMDLSRLWPPLLLAASLIIVPFACGLYHGPRLKLAENFFASLPPMLLVMFLGLIVSRTRPARCAWLILYVFAYGVAGTVQAVHLYLYGTPVLVSSVAAVLGTDTTEATQFIYHFFDAKTLLLIGCCVLLPLIPVRVVYKKAPSLRLLLLIAIPLLLVTLVRGQDKFLHHDPIGFFIDAYQKYTDQNDKLADIPVVTQEIKKHYSLALKDDQIFTLVVVIGESANRQHQQLYGYSRETNPWMKKRNDDMLILQDVISPAFFTGDSHNKMLMLPVRDARHPLSLIDMLRSLGVETWWITSQFAYNDHYSPLALRSEHIKTLANRGESSKGDDAKVLEELRQALRFSASLRRAVFININGSHVTYRSRYPENFEYFKGDAGITSKYSAKESVVDTINAYDNSIRYTDYLLDAMVAEIADQQNAVLLYLSDHGQDVYDVDEHATHCTASRIGADIPCWLWMSPSFQRWRSKDIAYWKENVGRPAVADCLGFMIADLLDISLADENRSRSPLSRSYVQYDRIIGNGVHYSDLRQQGID